MGVRNSAVQLFSYLVGGEEASDVIALTDSTLDQALQANSHILVQFYASWCGYCKRLAPEYEKAATRLKEADSKGKIAKVDGTVEKTAMRTYGIQGFPTLLYFENGNIVEKYGGARTADGIVSFMRKKAGEADL